MKQKPKKRATVHIRGSPRSTNPIAITGSSRLNEKAVKVLGAIKFSPSSISREDISDETSLQNIDVERQVKLLIQLNLIKINSKFPQFPQQGWRVYTTPEEHLKIITILKQHGMEDPRTETTRGLLGDYYPIGLQLEGDGLQQDRGRSYTQGIVVIPELEFRTEAIAVMKKFRDEIKPFQPKEFSQEAILKKKEKWVWFVKEMSRAYRVPTPNVTFGIFSEDSWKREGSSARDDEGNSSSFNRGTNTLYFTGRFSLVTLLHEFGHARGFDETDAIIWSQNFGLRIFPVTFNRLIKDVKPGTHMLTRSDETQRQFEL